MKTRSSDVVTQYRMMPEDFVKHLLTTLMIVILIVAGVSWAFSAPEAQPLTIKQYALRHPLAFEQMALRALDGQGQIANYGPPYNHGTASVQTGIQQFVGVIHPINAAKDFILKPLSMDAVVNPHIVHALHTFNQSTVEQRQQWEKDYAIALRHASVIHHQIITAPGVYGPLPQLLTATLQLGQSGLMSGALTRNGSIITRFNNQNYILFLQGIPLQNDPQTQQLAGVNWGIIHSAVNGYPGAWWMTVPTWIYQWPFVANSSAPDALALTIGFGFWLLLACVPWIPGLNRLPRYVGVYRLIWKNYYRRQQGDDQS